ncbi:hypothetical protein, partial [Plasmodium yoelii yoelii]
MIDIFKKQYLEISNFCIIFIQFLCFGPGLCLCNPYL